MFSPEEQSKKVQPFPSMSSKRTIRIFFWSATYIRPAESTPTPLGVWKFPISEAFVPRIILCFPRKSSILTTKLVCEVTISLPDLSRAKSESA